MDAVKRFLCKVLGHDWEQYFDIFATTTVYRKTLSADAKCNRCGVVHG